MPQVKGRPGTALPLGWAEDEQLRTERISCIPQPESTQKAGLVGLALTYDYSHLGG